MSNTKKTKMFRKIIKNIKQSRGFWNRVSYSDVGRLYSARLMRIVAIYLGAAFMSVYMLKADYSIVQVSLFWAFHFALKMLFTIPLAQVVASIGASRSILIANFLYIPSLIAFLFIDQYGIYALVITATLQSASTILYDIAHLTNFSRVNSAKKGGREVAMMDIAEKVARGLSPLIGGLLALFFDPKVAIVASIIFFIFAARPLMGENNRVEGFSLAPKGFPWRKAFANLAVQMPLGFNSYANGEAWTLFLAALIFASSNNQVYASMGVVTTLTLFVAMVSAFMFGKLIDRDKKGGQRVMALSALASVFVNMTRGFVRVPVAAFGVNATVEMAATGYSIVNIHNLFSGASESGYRVFYMGMVQLMANLGSFLAAIALAFFMSIVQVEQGFILFYLASGVIISSVVLMKYYAKNR